MPPAELCDIIDFWITAPWPMSQDEAQKRAVDRFGWTIEVENDTPYLMNTVSNFTTADVMTIDYKNVMMDLSFDTSDTIRDVTPESTDFLSDVHTLMVREGVARWGEPKLAYFKDTTTAQWNVEDGARVSFSFLPRGLTARYETPQGVELDRRAAHQ
ncbi:DUF6301 family protein [Paenarthrobacter aromaticivorans]|uniref:DUF6301 family protein n=1 Tax=Paenarthrobacter aromaticivorans TaxID=2849150 RepID=UPI003A8075E2